MTTRATASELFDEWTTYEKVVANDYMHHQDFFKALASEIGTCLQAPLSIVDLGCGDCVSVVPLLKRFDIKAYIGIDQSESALARAHSNLAATGVPFAVHGGSIVDELRNLEGDTSLVIASYSLHHLEWSAKQEVLTECRRLLRQGGLLAVIDVFLEEGETRKAYTRRWEKNALQNYSALELQEMKILLAHVRDNDFPETLESYRKLGRAAGFEQISPIAQDEERLNRLVILN